MSYSTLYQIFKTKVTPIAEFSNSWGSAIPLWQWLSRQFVGAAPGEYILGRDMKPLWSLATDMRVPEWARISHSFTFDCAVVTAQHQTLAVTSFREAYRVLNEWPEWGSGSVNHWNSIADSVADAKITRTCRGLGLACTSVSDPWQEKRNLAKAWDCITWAIEGVNE